MTAVVLVAAAVSRELVAVAAVVVLRPMWIAEH